MAIFAYRALLRNLYINNNQFNSEEERLLEDQNVVSYFLHNSSSLSSDMKAEMLKVAMHSSRFRVIESLISDEDFRILAQDNSFLFFCAKKGWTVGLAHLKRMGGALDSTNANGDNLALIAMKHGHLDTAYHLVNKEGINVHQKNLQGETALSISLLIATLEGSCFRGGQFKSNLFPALVDTYGSEKIKKKVTALNSEIGAQHAAGIELINAELNYHHPFKGEPCVIKLMEKDGALLPQFIWKKTSSIHHRTEKGIGCIDEYIKSYLDLIPNNQTFKDVDELEAAFQFLKMSPFPSKYTRNGCQYRAPWLQFLLTHLLKFKTEMIATPPENNIAFDLQLPFDPNIRWVMHTVVVVFLEDGTPYAMDTALPSAITLDDWKKALIGKRNPADFVWRMGSGEEGSVLQQHGYFKPDLEQIKFRMRNFYLNEYCSTEREIPLSRKIKQERLLINAIRTRNFAFAEKIWRSNNWSHLVNDRKFIFEVAKVGWIPFLLELKQRGANLSNLSPRGETLALAALKNGEEGMAHYLVNVLNNSAYQKDQSGESVHKVQKLVDSIQRSSFFLLELKDPQFPELIDTFETKKIRKVIDSIEEETEGAMIFERSSFPLVKKELKFNHPFRGTPYVKDFFIEREMLVPQIKWKKNITSLPRTNHGIVASNLNVKRILEQFPTNRRINSIHVLNNLFRFLKKEPLPLKNTCEGAQERVNWMEYVAGRILNYEVLKAVAIPQEGIRFSPTAHFPLDSASTWKAHAALVVMDELGDPFALDPILPSPLPLNVWKKSLGGVKEASINWYIDKQGDIGEAKIYLRKMYLKEYTIAEIRF